MNEELPGGFTVGLDARVEWLSADTLLGGAPPRILRLSPAARALLTGQDCTVAGPVSGRLARSLLDAGVAHPRLSGVLRPVSVIVPVRDRPAGLARLLGALHGTLPPGSEILVVDDGSADALAVRRAAAGSRVVRHDASRGPAAARNTGFSLARNDIAVFLDSDVVPLPGWLPPLLAHFDDPAVGLAAPRIVGLGAERGALAAYERVRSSLDLGPHEAPVVPRTRVAYVPSAALAVRVAAAPGGFAEDMTVAEDVELVCRLHAAGWRLRYDPSALVAHEHRDHFLPWLARKAFYGTGAAPLAVRHPGTVPPVNLPLWAAAACVLLGTQRRRGVLAAAAVGAVATWRLGRSLHARPRPLSTAARLNAMALGGAVWQSAAVLTRHWWPLALLTACVSRRTRRAVLAAALAEGLADWYRHRGALDPARYLVLHRLDDLAYGAGVWWGAIRGRTAAPLLPRFAGFRGRR
ncbi:mycofactocin biosynthesis glycosyltransferase MftF [Amycolatopsis antarctica]|nr:mycofactocin biosynthesis glycosyltransferase MftF [Amycolatopsis antarctica]